MTISREDQLRDLEQRWNVMDERARLAQLHKPRDRRFAWINRYLDLRGGQAGFKIPPPRDDPDYHGNHAGFVGDYRSLELRLTERINRRKARDQ